MAERKSSVDKNSSGRTLRPRKVKDVNETVAKPAKRSRRAISTIERGPASRSGLPATVNVQDWSKIESRSAPSVNDDGIRSKIAAKSVPSFSAEGGKILNTLVATNARLTGQLVGKDNLIEELQQKYIRALEKLYAERTEKLQLRTKADEHQKKIEKLEMEMKQQQEAAFCDDLIQLDETCKRKNTAFVDG